MRDRIRRAFEAGQRAVSAGAASQGDADPIRFANALLVMGHSVDDLDDLPVRHVETARTSGAIPLLISSSNAVATLQTPGLVCEHLPEASDVLEATGEPPGLVSLYILRRLELIFDKWLVAECTWFGAEAEALVAMRQGRPELARSRVSLREAK